MADRRAVASSIGDLLCGVPVLVAKNFPATNLVQSLSKIADGSVKRQPTSLKEGWRGQSLDGGETWISSSPATVSPGVELDQSLYEATAGEIDPFYLFACQVEWERYADTGAAWEVISGAQSLNQNTRAHSRSLLERSDQLPSDFSQERNSSSRQRAVAGKEPGMKTPYGLEVIESCMGCKASREGFFCHFSPAVLRSLDAESQHTVMPSGALLFVEGQSPRGVHVLCSGKVKLSTTSREGKVLILKQAEAGEVLGLSAAISGTNYEMSAETCTPCQLNFISRQDLIKMMQNQGEVGMHAAQSLSREFQGAYRDIHDLVLARSSSGKLARLLLSCTPQGLQETEEQRMRSVMTHEEMAQRIGSSRETVTRLLSHLKKKRLIRIEGATLVIRDRSGLEALAF